MNHYFKLWKKLLKNLKKLLLTSKTISKHVREPRAKGNAFKHISLKAAKCKKEIESRPRLNLKPSLIPPEED